MMDLPPGCSDSQSVTSSTMPSRISHREPAALAATTCGRQCRKGGGSVSKWRHDLENGCRKSQGTGDEMKQTQRGRKRVAELGSDKSGGAQVVSLFLAKMRMGREDDHVICFYVWQCRIKLQWAVGAMIAGAPAAAEETMPTC